MTIYCERTNRALNNILSIKGIRKREAKKRQEETDSKQKPEKREVR